MKNCVFCRNPLDPLSAWRANDGGFYCNEFCADAADDTSKQIARQEIWLEEQAIAA